MFQHTDEDPAVTKPSFLKIEGNLVKCWRVVWGRGCSSVLTIISCFFTVIVTGTISSLKRPASLAEIIFNFNVSIHMWWWFK